MRPKQFIDIPRIEQFYRIDEDGAIYSLRKKRYLKPSFNSAGYLFVHIQLHNEDGSVNKELSRFYGVHRIVATKYIGQCPPNKETSHSDGNKQNNHWTNFEYLTHAENILKSYQEHNRSKQCFLWPRNPFSDETKELMSNAKKKPVTLSQGSQKTTFPSIEDAAKELNTYRKKIYNCITKQKEFISKANPEIKGFLSFLEGKEEW